MAGSWLKRASMAVLFAGLLGLSPAFAGPPMCEDCGGGDDPPAPPAYVPQSRWVFHHLDHLGTPRLLLDERGAVVSQRHHLPFGEERPAQTETTLSTRAFTGHERDAESGLDYMMARYYSASLGRFLRIDPGFDADVVFPQSWNMYTYVRNNPIVGIDPFGEDTLYVNRKLGSDTGPPVSKYNPLSHQLLVTTGPPTADHPNGVVERVSSWNNGTTTLSYADGRGNPNDLAVAQQGLDEGKGRWAGGEDLDPLVEEQMDATRDAAHPSHHRWGLWRTCKGEARRLVGDARKKAKEGATSDPEEEQRQQKKEWLGQLDNSPNTDGPQTPGQKPRVLIDGVDTSDPYDGS